MLINTASTHKGGSVQVAKSFLEECKNYPEHTFHVVLGNLLDDLTDRQDYPENFHFYPIGYRPATRVFHYKNRDAFFSKLEAEISPDVVFTTSGPAYWRPNAPHLAGYNLPHYIYRDSPYFDQISPLNRLKWDLKGRVIKYFFKQDADAYVVQTDDVNRRLRTWLGTNSVYTVTNTCSEDYRSPKPVPYKLPLKKQGEFRFLTLSAWYGHKNLDLIPEIVKRLPEELRERVRFVVTVPENTFRDKFPKETFNNIHNIGLVKPDEGPSLYKECDALFLPTLLECFSASYPEAMMMDRPIVTTDMGFARTICGDAALYFRPTDPDDAIQKIKKVIEHEEIRNRLVEEGKKQLRTFDTPKERAEKYLMLCEQLTQREIRGD